MRTIGPISRISEPATRLRRDHRGSIARGTFAGIFGALLAALVVLIVYINLTPTFASQTADLATDPNLSANEQSLVSLATLAWILGIPILGFAVPFFVVQRFFAG